MLIESEEGMTEEGIAIAIVMSLTGVGPAAKEEIHPIHPIHPIWTTMTSTDADAPARIATIDKIDIKTTVETDSQDNPHPSLIRAPRNFHQACSDSSIPIKTRFAASATNSR